MPARDAPANPFVYGRVLTTEDAACPRPALTDAIVAAASQSGRLALIGDRRVGKSTLVERTLAGIGMPVLRWDFHEVYSPEDVAYRAAVRLETFLESRSWVARRVSPWLREIGVTLEAVRVGYRGADASFGTRVPTDHLARLLGYLAPLAKRGRFALFVDELQDLKDRLPDRQGDAVLGLLRSELQRLDVPQFFAGSARESFHAIFTRPSSPFYESARLLEVPPIPAEEMRAFLVQQFERARKKIAAELAAAVVAVAGDSPNDVQHLAHEVYAATPGAQIDAAAVGLATTKILRDLSPMMGVLWADLTARQQRLLLTVALYEHLGAGTAEFHRLAGVHNQGSVVAGLKPFLSGPDAIVEKVGSRYRVRQRFVRLWLATARTYVEQHLPPLREPAAYEAALAAVAPDLRRLMPLPPPGG